MDSSDDDIDTRKRARSSSRDSDISMNTTLLDPEASSAVVTVETPPTAGSSTGTSKKSISQQRSKVWDHFERVANDSQKALCKHCKKLISREGGSTTGMRSHMHHNHRKQWKAKAVPAGDVAIKAFTNPLFREYLEKWIVVDDQPFTVVENVAFRELVGLLNPHAIVPSGDTIKTGIMASYHKERERVRKELQDAPGKISFTLDAWTAPNKLPFLGITAHWIDGQWRLKSTLVDFQLLTGPHSGENMAAAVLSSWRWLGILTKINTITADNASNNGRMMDVLEDTLAQEGITFKAYDQWIRCLAHVINLAVQEALKELNGTAAADEDDEDDTASVSMTQFGAIAKLRQLVVKIRASPQRREKLRKQCEPAKLKELQPVADVKTRWNSTYNMLERAIYLREALHQVASADPDLTPWKLTEEEWRQITEIEEFLKIFMDATQFMSGDYPTLSSSIQVYNTLIDYLEEEGEERDIRKRRRRSNVRKRADEHLVNAANAAHRKLCQFYSTTSAFAYTAAVFLHPSQKLEYYKIWDWEDVYIDSADQQFQAVYAREYAPGSRQSSLLQPSEQGARTFAKRLQEKMQRDKPSDELGDYRSTGCVPVSDDPSMPLTWWRANEMQYPSLAKMARDYLASPGTSVPIERIFSGGTDLVTQKRSSLGAETITACMCLKAWAKLNLGDKM